ncbi:MAG: Grx4 family monothiol glutaredoxin [Myxococcota bacterium]|nr:Grx4 family monothiol glutaredoxin [Myxococcota bacterium]
MALDEGTRQEIINTIGTDNVVLFMKGSKGMPQCGFSATVVQILNELVEDYATVDVLSDPALREGIKAYSNWPTIPQLYIKGEFIGGCDIVKQMYESGDLEGKLDVVLEPVEPPSITVTDAGAKALNDAIEANPDGPSSFHLVVNEHFEPGLQFGPESARKLKVEANGVTFFIDRSSAPRAEGITIDFMEGADGSGFKIENPNAPKPVEQLSVGEIKAKLDAKESFVFIDVRGEDERLTATISGTQLLDDGFREELTKMDRDTYLVFHCHHGGRSQQAADHYRNEGFSRVANMVGGIDAWSLEIDSDIPRY